MKFYGKPTRCNKSTMFLNTTILSIYAMNVICNSVFLQIFLIMQTKEFAFLSFFFFRIYV